MRYLYIFVFLTLFSVSLESDELILGLDNAVQMDAADVTELCLGGSGLDNLPPFFCDFTNLTYLNMAQNELTALPECCSNFDKLTELNLSANYLSDISAIKGMSSLEILDLSMNDSLDAGQLGNLSDLKQLAQLDLSYLNLNSIPESIYLLKNLKELILTGNNITQKDLDNLKQINRNLHIII